MDVGDDIAVFQLLAVLYQQRGVLVGAAERQEGRVAVLGGKVRHRQHEGIVLVQVLDTVEFHNRGMLRDADGIAPHRVRNKSIRLVKRAGDIIAVLIRADQHGNHIQIQIFHKCILSSNQL